MPTIPDGVCYRDGIIEKNSTPIVEFDPVLNPELHLYLLTTTLAGLEYDLSGWPDYVMIDSVQWDINQEEDASIFADLHATYQTVFGISAADSKAVIREQAKAFKKWIKDKV